VRGFDEIQKARQSMLVNQLNSKKDDAKSAEKGPVRGFEEILKARETMIRKQTIATQ